jgi:molecular chaperone DnaJ
VLHLRGRGLPRVNASGTGDLHVRLQQWTPDGLGEEESRLLRRLMEIRPTAPDKREKGFWAKVKESLGA